ncbi:MAG: hypothetical protein KDB01_15905 [Planctomycetaceae bacterium]|nr:hypothetical protein [Planctomycetaceae bacterium]
MQSSMWKLITAVGIIGIGTLVVLEVQSRLPRPSQASSVAPSTDAALARSDADTDVIPDATTELDKMLAGTEVPDDMQFALNEPDADSEPPAFGKNSDSQAKVVETPVSRTVMKDSLTDDDNPFERSVEVAEQPVRKDSPAETATAEPLSEPGSVPIIQPTSFAGESVPVTGSKSPGNAASGTTSVGSGKQAGSSGTVFFSGNSGQKNAALANPSPATPVTPAEVTPKPTAKTIPVSAQTFQDTRTAQARPAPATPVDDDSIELFMPDPVSEIVKPEEADTIPNFDNSPKLPEEDVPLMDVPGFDADSSPNFDITPRPESPNFPDRDPAPADTDPVLPERTPEPDPATRFFEPDAPQPEPRPDNPRSRPDTRKTPPVDFDMEPVPDLREPRPIEDSGLRTTPRSPVDDDFPAPSYPDRRSRPELDENSPFDSAPRRRDELGDALELPAIPDGPRGSAPDRSRVSPGDSSSDSPDRNFSQVMRPQLSIQKRAPERATVGVPHEYTIVVSNEGDSSAYDVIVDDELGDAAKLEYSKPSAEFDRASGKLSWKIQELAPRENQQILVRITPTGEGTLDGVATVRFKAQVKSATVITAPKITLEVTGPPEVKVGDEVQLQYTVRNSGTGDASNVILRSVLPPGLKHSEGGDLEYEIEHLRAGDQEKIDLTVIAAEPGSLRANSEVTVSGVSADRTTTAIDIVGAQLTIQRLGPERRFVGRTATFQNIIANDSNFEANKAVVTEQVPEGMRFVSADNGGVYNPQTGRIRWEIERLLPHKQTVLEVELEALSAGRRQTIVEVVESAGFRSQATENTIVTVEDYENMTADISRQDAPVAVGETFGFTITIENRGTAVARNAEMVVNVPSEISVKAAGTRTNPARRVGNSVHYALVEAIQPGEKMTFELKLQGERPAQNALVRASLKYEHLKDPLIVTESVTIFEDRP